MTYSRVSALDSAKAASLVLEARGLPFTYRNYVKYRKPGDPSPDALRRALSRGGIKPSWQDIAEMVGFKYQQKKTWQASVLEITEKYGRLSTREYDQMRDADMPSSSSIYRQSGLSWTSIMEDMSEYPESVNDSLEHLCDIRERNQGLTPEEYDTLKNEHFHSSSELIKLTKKTWQSLLEMTDSSYDIDFDSKINDFLDKEKHGSLE